MMRHPILRYVAAIAITALPGGVVAEGDPEPGLSIELNKAETQEGSCTLTFLVRNAQESMIDAAVFETVIFDVDGQVDRLTLLDFGSLPAGRSRVRQFVISGTECGGIGRLLFNGAETCEAGDLGPKACNALEEPTSRTAIEVLG